MGTQNTIMQGEIMMIIMNNNNKNFSVNNKKGFCEFLCDNLIIHFFCLSRDYYYYNIVNLF